MKVKNANIKQEYFIFNTLYNSIYTVFCLDNSEK